MKDLKYIKLFEAFESSKLSSILSFVKDKNKFIALLKKICDTIDYPYSKLSDDFFEYLPFKKALYRNIEKIKEKCDAESDTVPGEFCKNGMIKRTWGKGYRFKECDVCHGTGIKPVKDSVKLIKFWFDVDGEFVQVTGSDGKVRNGTFSDNISDYEKVKVLSKADYIHDGINNGDIILMKINDRYVVGYLYKNSYGSKYLLQNKDEAGSTPGGTDWQKVARFSWALSLSDFSYNNAYLLKLKDTEVKRDIDPYSVNGLLNISYNGLAINNSAAYDTKSIKNADFALILDVDKLKTSKFSKLNTIKNDREVSRKGSLFLKKDSDIKRENIKRYIDKISNSSNVKGTIEDLNNCNKMFNRILGGKNMLYFIHPDSNESSKSRLDSIATKMFHMFKSLNSGNIDEVNSYVGSINYSLPSYIRNVSDVNVNINSVIDVINKDLDTEYKETFELIKKLGDTIYKHISNYKIETLDDIEMILQEIVFISSLLYTGRYPNLGKLNRFFYRITNSSAKNVYDSLVSGLNSTSIDDINTEINTIIRLIKKHEMIR